MASPALAGPANSTIGAKKLEQDMVHSGGVGYPSMMYEWWNKGKGKMDWGLSGELVYGDWLAAHTGRYIKIGLGIDGMLRWNILSNKKPKVQNDFAILVKPGILDRGQRQRLHVRHQGRARPAVHHRRPRARDRGHRRLPADRWLHQQQRQLR